ncbi:MAG: amidase family protein, partial [Gallionellaceae bacterium]|nr:amidase family protein [Gallionellaceae bacterium]
VAAPYPVEEVPLSQISADLAAGGTTSVVVTEAYIERIKAYDDKFNAVVMIAPDAVQQAAASDQRRKEGKSLGPLDGIPILLKDNIDAVGMPTTVGSFAMLENMPAQDSEVARRLRAAGVVILGKANTSQWAGLRTTSAFAGSTVGGTTRNPYDLTRTAAGSSSGSGIAAAASLAAATVGTDTTGSIMGPSSMMGLVGIFLVKNLFLAFLAWRQARFAYGVQVQISQRLFTTYLHQPYTFHLQRNSAQLIRNVMGEVNLFTSALIGMLAITSESLVLLGIAILLLLAEPMGALASMMVLGIAAWAFYRSTRNRLTRWGKARQYHDGLRIQHLQQGLGGAKDVKLLGREEEFLAQYRAHNVQSGRVGQLQVTLQQFPRLWLELLAVSGLAVLVLSMVWQGRDMGAIIPTLALFAAAAFRLIPSVNRILAAMQSLRFSRPVIDTLHEELKLGPLEPDGIPANDAGSTRRAFQSEMRLSGISYSYQGAAGAALDDMSLVIRQGEFVGFIGPSGSGKSTLVDVILGLLPPGAGRVMVDGQNIQQDLRVWQDQIGYVPQT